MSAKKKKMKTDDLLGDSPVATPAKKAKATKAVKAPKTPKAEKPAKEKKSKAEKALKEPKPAKEKRVKLTDEEKAVKKAQRKAEKKAARAAARGTDDRVPVDQTPTEVPRDHDLKPASIALLVFLHEKTTEPTAMAEIAVKLKTDTRSIAAQATSLVNAGLVEKDEKAKTLDVIGKRHDNLTDLQKAIAKLTKELGHMPTSAAIGKELYSDPKKAKATDSVRFGRAAGRLLQGAFRMGIIRQFTQPRRKFSAEKTRTLYAVVA